MLSYKINILYIYIYVTGISKLYYHYYYYILFPSIVGYCFLIAAAAVLAIIFAGDFDIRRPLIDETLIPALLKAHQKKLQVSYCTAV